MAPPNPTGFDMKAFTNAATSREWRAKDPWVRNEAWRYNGPFTRWNRFKGSFPGLGIATVAFAGYVIFEAMFLKDSHGHGEGHGDKH
ncbi:uncharacterized protein A1O9_03426 [Exophiala aquamarina CBS 119918]|uniref:NADH dehydrogenase (Ubiquinone) 1 beta subcomplex 3 n=1 Tax=Exophiala aquamarina CBS 119918 TaxID=1182545 RepID=A0A072Q1V0_9EURO|nr:uncharacterized protein A1O9_03426 [Exophiala aquamarina CBS 119918]KEF61855.1 hypothetical protein A1O9_03426 [Exophiala aquamarina CBS 119918]